MSKELHNLLENDDWEGVKRLLDAGLEVDAPFAIDDEYFPCTPLQQASSLGALRVIEGLIDRGANLAHNRSYGTALDCAVAFEKLEAAKLLLGKGANPNARGPSEIEGDASWTPLLRAVFRNNLPMIELLIRFRADPRVVSRKRIGVITCAAFNQQNELVQRFGIAGAPYLGNALLCAVEKENEKLVQLLLREGCDPNYEAGKVELFSGEEGETPLSLAIKHLSTARVVGDLRGALGREKEQEACLKGIVNLLLSSGADPNKRVHGRTPLSLAVWAGDVEVVRLLSAAGSQN